LAAPKLEIVVNNAITLLEATRNFAAQPDKMNSFINLAQVELQNYLLGAIPSYRPGSPTPPVSAQITSDVAMLLQPFLMYETLVDGKTIKPGYWFVANTMTINDIAKLVDLRPSYSSQSSESSAEILTNSEFIDRVKSYSKAPTALEPVAEYFSEGFVFSPADPNLVEMIAYKVPEQLDIPFDPNTGDFDYTNVTDILWPYKALPYLTYLIISKFGLPINNPNMIQIGEQLAKLSI
jgi:hypothetical protein